MSWSCPINKPCIIPADTKHNIYVVFMLEGYVKIMLDFMLECLVFFNVKMLMLYLQHDPRT